MSVFNYRERMCVSCCCSVGSRISKVCHLYSQSYVCSRTVPSKFHYIKSHSMPHVLEYYDLKTPKKYFKYKPEFAAMEN